MALYLVFFLIVLYNCRSYFFLIVKSEENCILVKMSLKSDGLWRGGFFVQEFEEELCILGIDS